MEISARHQEQKVTMPSGAEKVAVIKSSSSSAAAAAAAAAEGGRIKKARPEKEEEVECPRCSSTKTKFCYYNNYSISQPRYFCKNCRRYWTQGGSLRNVPVGGGCRKSTTNKHHHQRSSASSSSFSPSSKMMMMNNKLHQLPMAMPMPMPAVFPPPACATGGSFFPNVLPTFIPSTVTGTGGFQLPGDHLSLASSNLGAGGGASASTFMDILTAGGGGGINGIFDGKNLENQLMMSSSDSDYYYGGGGGNNGMISMMPPPPQTTTTAAFGGGCDLMSQQHGLQLVGDDANNANNANTATASVAQLHGGGELASLEEQLGLGNAASGVDVMMGGAGAGPSSSSRDYCYWNSSTSSNFAGAANMPPWQGGLIDSSNPLM